MGGLDLLVCNAGVLNGYSGLRGSENALTPEAMATFADVLATNIAGPLFSVQAFYRICGAVIAVGLRSSPHIWAASSTMQPTLMPIDPQRQV